MKRHNWPIVLAVLFVGQLVWYILYTERIVQSITANHEVLSRVYAEVQRGFGDPRQGSADEALFRLQGVILETGLPLVLTGPGDSIIAAENLPFAVDLNIPSDHGRVRDYLRRIDLLNPPLGDPEISLIHYGRTPEVLRLRWIPFLQAGGLILTVLLGVVLIRVQRRAQGERAWTAMARELAHQLGTPISSLQGWLEVLSLPPEERPGGMGSDVIAQELGADLLRLERISNRFELIGREPELEEIDLGELLSRFESYMESRLPRLASGIIFEVEVAPDLTPILGSEVLLTWALENVVKNAMDAIGGGSGSIRIRARDEGTNRVRLSVSDTGPGIPPELRSEIFEPGVTTKPRGWGVGLALSRRIVEGVHNGRIELGEDLGTGATFHFHLPASQNPIGP